MSGSVAAGDATVVVSFRTAWTWMDLEIRLCDGLLEVTRRDTG